MPQPKNMQLNPEALEEKEKQIMLDLMAKYDVRGHQSAAQSRAKSVNMLFGDKNKSVAGSSSKKREMKAAGKDDMMSVHSEKTNRTLKSGRFEAKYKVGDKTASGAIIKKVREEDWQLVEKDKKGNSYYTCLKCSSAAILRKDNRKTHTCK
jgi:hypothetical protein